MKNKKVISLLLALAMVMSFVCPAFAAIEVTVNTNKEEYYFGETVKVSGTSEQDEMYCVSTKQSNEDAKNIIIIDSFDAVNGKYEFEIVLPDDASDMWPAGTYTIEVAGVKDTFVVVESDDEYNIRVSGTNCEVTVDPETAKEGEEVTITIEPKKNYYVKSVTVRGEDSNRKITTSGGRNDEYTFEMPAEDVRVTVTCAKESSGGGSSGGSSGGGGGIIISGTTGLGTPSGNTINAVLNENQYSKYGVEPSAVSVRGSKLSSNTFSVAVAINGDKYTTFDGYNPVMVKVPYTSTAVNTNNLVVIDQYGNVVPRSLYKNGYMYVAMDDINGIFSIVEVNKSFADTNIDWANQAINALAARDIINGMGDGTFAPNDTVTRAQFVKMIISMFDIHNPNATSTFADVAGDEWYASYVATAKDLGITLGYAEDNTFRPNNIITREEMSTMLYRAADVMTVKLDAVKAATTFADDAYIQDYAKTAVYNMQKAGVLQGVGNNMFDPQGSCTRAQAAVAIYNMFQVTMNF